MRKRAMVLMTAFSLVFELQPLVAQGAASQIPMPETAWQVIAGGAANFDVASVRQAPPGASMTPGAYVLDALDMPLPSASSFSAMAPFMSYLIFAYKITDVSQYGALYGQLPKWGQTSLFVIEARSQANPTKDQVRLMMQALLKERFKLALRSETKQVPIFALETERPDKTGPQLQPHSDAIPCIERSSEKSSNPSKTPASSTRPIYCGTDWWMQDGQAHMRMINVTMEQVASYLGGVGGALGDMDRRPVMDETGLQGRFDFVIDFVPRPNGPQGAIADPQADVAGPTMTQAMTRELGLKLVKKTKAVNAIVIDHIEPPSEN